MIGGWGPAAALMSNAQFDEAVERAARLLSKSRAPVIAGLGADIAGIVAAFRLAEKVGGTIDHMAAESALRDQAVLQDVGLMLVSPGEARRRADTLFVVGDRPMEAQPDLLHPLLADRPGVGAADAHGRRVIVLASHEPYPAPGNNIGEWLAAAPPALPGVLAALRARVNGRPVARDFDPTELDRCAKMLKAAKFGVAIWSPDEHNALVIEMLVGLIQDLNAKTRWSGLSVCADATVAGAAMASGWMTGLPLRCSFGRGRAEHDPWRDSARRLVESGEADVIVWISACGDPPPAWVGAIPAIVLTETPPAANGHPAVALPVGRPGRDHDGVLFNSRTGTLFEVAAESLSNTPSVAEALTEIAARLDAR